MMNYLVTGFRITYKHYIVNIRGWSNHPFVSGGIGVVWTWEIGQYASKKYFPDNGTAIKNAVRFIDRREKENVHIQQD